MRAIADRVDEALCHSHRLITQQAPSTKSDRAQGRAYGDVLSQVSSAITRNTSHDGWRAREPTIDTPKQMK